MADVRETYDLPRKPPAVIRYIGFLLAFVVGAPLLWLILPDGIVTVGGLAILFLVVIAFALRSILSSRDVHQPPPRRPVPTRPD